MTGQVVAGLEPIMMHNFITSISGCTIVTDFIKAGFRHQCVIRIILKMLIKLY